MATTKNVTRTPSGKIKYRGKPLQVLTNQKRTPGSSKKSAVLAKKGDQIKLVRFGDPNMSIKKDQPSRRKSFRARHSCDTAKDKFLLGIGLVKRGKKMSSLTPEEVLDKLAHHEMKCELRYKNIEERLDSQKEDLKGLSNKLWFLVVLIIVTPMVHRLWG